MRLPVQWRCVQVALRVLPTVRDLLVFRGDEHEFRFPTHGQHVELLNATPNGVGLIEGQGITDRVAKCGVMSIRPQRSH